MLTVLTMHTKPIMTTEHQTILQSMESDAVAVAALCIAARSGRDSNQVPLGSRLDHEIALLPDRLRRLLDLADRLEV